jgi:hypothetical protein
VPSLSKTFLNIGYAFFQFGKTNLRQTFLSFTTLKLLHRIAGSDRRATLFRLTISDFVGQRLIIHHFSFLSFNIQRFCARGASAFGGGSESARSDRIQHLTFSSPFLVSSFNTHHSTLNISLLHFSSPFLFSFI